MSLADCMNKYKGEFTMRFAQVMQKNLFIWKELQKKFKRNLYTKDLWWYFGGYLLGYIPGRNETHYDLHFHMWFGLVFVVAAIFMCIGWENKSYQNEIKKTLFQKLLDVFGENINYGVGCISNQEFEDSGLYNHSIETRTDDDCFEGIYNDVKFIINETDFGYETRDSKGRRQYHSMFKGVAMRFKLQKLIKARVLIHSKTLFKYVPHGFEKVSLEYPEFAKKYEVYAKHDLSSYEGQIEARYLLNVAFLDRFMQLKTSFKTNNIKLSVFGDTMYVMLATGRDLFEMNHLFGKIDDIRQYETLFDEFASVLSFMDVLNLASKTGL